MSQQNKRHGRNQKALLGGLLFILLIGFFQVFSFNPASEFLHYIGRPLWQAQLFLRTEVSHVPEFFSMRRQLIELNEELSNKLQTGEHTQILLKATQHENDALKELLGRKDTRTLLLATILSRPGSSPYDTLIIDVGMQHDVSKGDLVFAQGDFVIGEIAEVFRSTSLVRLFSTPGTKTNVTIEPISLFVVAEGRGGGNFITQLPRDVEVSIGDIVGLPDLAIDVFAVVDEIVETPTGPFQVILFRSPINIQQLRFVEVRKQ